jgi:hypothetical protein
MKQHERNSHSKKRWSKWAIFVSILVFVVVTLALYVLSALNLIPAGWAAALGAISAVLSAAFPILDRVIPLLFKEESPRAEPHAPHIPTLLGAGSPAAVLPSSSRIHPLESVSLSPSVFLVNVLLPHTSEFFGREKERAILLNRLRSRASTSIVGPRRIGKTWLLMYLYLLEVSMQSKNNTYPGYIDVSR